MAAVKVKLGRAVDHGIRIIRHTKDGPAGRNPSDNPLLNGHFHIVVNPFLCCYPGYPVRHAKTQVNYAAFLQFHSRPSGYHFPLIQNHRRDGIHRHLQISCQSRIVFPFNGLHLPRAYDYRIHQNPGNSHILRIQGASLCRKLHLADYGSATVMHRLSDR